jgi:hypothetical protein
VLTVQDRFPWSAKAVEGYWPWEGFPGHRDRYHTTSQAVRSASYRALTILQKSKIKTMLQLFLAILLALTNPAHSGTNGSNSNPNQVITMDSTGGDTGDIPPTPPGN